MKLHTYHQSDLLDCARGVLQRTEHHNTTAIDAACEIVIEMSIDQSEIARAAELHKRNAQEQAA